MGQNNGKGYDRSVGNRSPVIHPTTKIFEEVMVPRTLTVDGASGVGFGSVSLGALPKGNIALLAALGNFIFTGPTSAGLGDTWEGDFSIGTTAASDGSLTGADVNILGSTALAAATAEASPQTKANNVTPVFIDNTAGNLELYLNLLVDDADISADDIDMTVTGNYAILFSLLGSL